MKRKVFYSFHFDNDAWRAGQVRNMGVIEGNQPVSGNEWEEVKKSENSIKKWIDDNLKNKSCLVVLIGKQTSEREWVKYEIKRAWELGKAVCGIYIHKLKDSDEKQSSKGKNPFSQFTLGKDKKNFADIVPVFESSHSDSKDVYDDISENLENLVEKAISIRNEYK